MRGSGASGGEWQEPPIPRLAPLLTAAICLGLSPLPATALSALFDFDDFPAYGDSIDPDAPYTYLYGCDGKDYCTDREVEGATTDWEGAPDKIATTRNGISMEFGRYGANYSLNFDGWGVLDTGDDGDSYFTLFLFDFDTPLRSFQAEISGPQVIDSICDDDDVCTDVYSLIKLYLWSDPGGQGTLVGSLTIDSGDVFGGTVSLVADQPFRSANLGHAVPSDPDCIVRPYPNTCGTENGRERYYDSYGIDDIFVSTVPEPSTAALVCLGLIGAAAARRARPIR